MWVVTLLHNVDTLEVYEEAIRHTEEDLHQTTNHQKQDVIGDDERRSPTHTPEHTASTTDAAHVKAGPIARQPRHVKAHDPAKHQRQQQHRQNVIMAADKRRQLGMARAAIELLTIPEELGPSDPTAPRQR